MFRLSIVGLIVMMFIAENEGKSVAIYDAIGKVSKKTSLSDGKIRLPNGFNHLILSPAQKIHIIIMKWSELVACASDRNIPNANVLSEHVKRRKPMVKLYLISFGGYNKQSYQSDVFALLELLRDPNQGEPSHYMDIIDFDKDYKYAPFDICNDDDIIKSYNNFKIVPTSLDLNNIIPQPVVAFKGIRIYDPNPGRNAKVTPLELTFDEHHQKYKSFVNYFYTIPNMETHIFITNEESYTEIFGNIAKKTVFDQEANEFFQQNKHSIMIGVFQITDYKEIKRITEMLVAHYGLNGKPQKDVFIAGEKLFDTIYKPENGDEFGLAHFPKFSKMHNYIRPQKRIKLIMSDDIEPGKIETSTVTFNVRTVNGIYDPENEHKKTIYFDSRWISLKLCMLIIDDEIFAELISVAKIHYFVASLNRMKEIFPQVAVMICEHFGRDDVHHIEEFFSIHIKDEKNVFYTMGEGIFNLTYKHGNHECHKLEVIDELKRLISTLNIVRLRRDYPAPV